MKNKSLTDPATRARLRDALCGRGIDPIRLELLPPTGSIADHLATYEKIDIALDTFPYHGTTTTLEALWMGVPVVCQAGALHVSRVGVSILSNLGLSELIAPSRDEYAANALRLAEDAEHLRHLRGGLRELLRRSPLTDAKRFVSDVETALRGMWRAWREKTTSTEPEIVRF